MKTTVSTWWVIRRAVKLSTYFRKDAMNCEHVEGQAEWVIVHRHVTLPCTSTKWSGLPWNERWNRPLVLAITTSHHCCFKFDKHQTSGFLQVWKDCQFLLMFMSRAVLLICFILQSCQTEGSQMFTWLALWQVNRGTKQIHVLSQCITLIP